MNEEYSRHITGPNADIETLDKDEKIEFKVTHNSFVDNASSAYDFSKALKEIKMWSDNNPDHIPVYIIIEPKSFVIEINGMKKFSLDYAKELEKVIVNELGDSLLTPKDMLRDMPRIFAELGNGSIDIDKYGFIFVSNQFIQAGKQYCQEQLALLNSLYRAYTALYNSGGMYQNELDIYNNIVTKINMYQYIFNIICIVDQNKSYQPIKKLQYDLSTNYRNFIQRGVTI